MDNRPALKEETFSGDLYSAAMVSTTNAAARKREKANPILDTMLSEGSEHFFHYLNRMGLSQEPDLLILSSRHHYYYDHDDLRNVKILVNLKKLNFIKHLDSFLHVLFRMLPPRSKFIGCFTNSQSIKSKGFNFNQSSSLFSRFFNFLDSRTDRQLKKDEVAEILESHGFKVLDMTELNGDIYFSTQNKKMSLA